MTALYRDPTFRRLTEASGGVAYAALLALQSAAEEDGTARLSEGRIRQALAPFALRAQRKARRVLAAVGLLVGVTGGAIVHPLSCAASSSAGVAPAAAPASPPATPLPSLGPEVDERTARRREGWKARQRKHRGHPVDEAPTSGPRVTREPVTPSVTQAVTPSVTGPVTPLSEEILGESPSPSPVWDQKERGESPSDAREPVTPSRPRHAPPVAGRAALDGLLGLAMAGAALEPERPSAEQVIALWARLFDRPASDVATRDRAHLEHRLAQGATFPELRAVLLQAKATPYFVHSPPADPAYRLAVLCGPYWEELRDKGLGRRGSARRPAPPPAPVAAPSPPPSAPREVPPRGERGAALRQLTAEEAQTNVVGAAGLLAALDARVRPPLRRPAPPPVAPAPRAEVA